MKRVMICLLASLFLFSAAACCAQGIEFILTDDYAWPGDYPEEGEEITVIGSFDTYYEGEYLYCTLRDAVIE